MANETTRQGGEMAWSLGRIRDPKAIPVAKLE